MIKKCHRLVHFTYANPVNTTHHSLHQLKEIQAPRATGDDALAIGGNGNASNNAFGVNAYEVFAASHTPDAHRIVR